MTKLQQRNVPGGETSTVASRIRRSQESLSPAELKLLQALLANCPAAGLESTNALAKKVGISAPTVLASSPGSGSAGTAISRALRARRYRPGAARH